MESAPVTPLPHNAASSGDLLRIRKRKLEDAFQSLDNAVQGPQPSPDRRSTPKRTHMSRSIYTTLAKYGIKSKDPKSNSDAGSGTPPTLLRSSTAPELGAGASSNKTPHLAAILSRAATRTKNAFSFKLATSASPTLLPASAEYRPSSLQSFLSRLETFKLSTYSNKPSAIDAVAASRCGWTNDGKDRLVCGFCDASWVVGGREGMTREAANTLVEKQRQGLVDNHKNGCPWKTRQCDPSIYCIPLKSPTSMIKDLKAKAVSINPLVEDIGIRHPLTQHQLHSLKRAIASYELTSESGSKAPAPPDAMEVDEPPTPIAIAEPSEAAILTSLFGWDLVPPTMTTEPRRRVSAARTAAPSAAPSRPATPTGSRRSSISLPRSSPATETRGHIFRIPSALLNKRENALLQCNLCQRRIGLWAFAARKPEETLVSSPLSSDEQVLQSPPSKARAVKSLPQRQFDLLKEHRSYCPYVVRSTVVPSLPPPPESTNATPRAANGHRRSNSSLTHPNGALEGWRAALAVVLRYGMAQRQRAEYDVFGQSGGNEGDSNSNEGSQELDNVKAMVAGVKKRGGRDLLKYVKGLLA